MKKKNKIRLKIRIWEEKRRNEKVTGRKTINEASLQRSSS